MRLEKESMVQEIRERLDASEYVITANYLGMSVAELEELRGQLDEEQSELHVVRNAFLERAAKDKEWDAFAESLDGPTAMVTGQGDVTRVAKLLLAFARRHERPVVAGGHLEGQVLTAADITTMSKIPPREVLLGQLVGTVAAPMTQLAGVMRQKVLSLLYVLKAVEEKKQ
jgi:large subunit ribosomal protein L10